MNPLYELDQNVFRALHVDISRDWLDPIMVAFSDSGRGEIYITVLLAFCFVFRYRVHALLALSAGVVSGLFAQLVKQLVERDRPSNFDFSQPILTFFETLYGQTTSPMGDNSFPSGHATSCFAIAVAIAWASRRTEHSWVGWAVMGWATLVGLSRVYVGVHFVSDVIAGAALGAVFGTLFYLLWRHKGWISAP